MFLKLIAAVPTLTFHLSGYAKIPPTFYYGETERITLCSTDVPNVDNGCSDGPQNSVITLKLVLRGALKLLCSGSGSPHNTSASDCILV